MAFAAVPRPFPYVVDGLPVPASLPFRTACNDVVEASGRPVKRRVREGLARNRDFVGLRDTLWDQALRLSASRPPAPTVTDRDVETFFQLLVHDTRWRTLVVEEVDAERRWSGLVTRTRSGLVDKVVSAIEKMSDPHHPFARTAAAVAVSGATLYGSYKVVTHVEQVDKITIPVAVNVEKFDKVVPITFVTDGVPAPLKVALDPTTAHIPIDFTPSKATVDVRVQTVDGAGSNNALGRIADAVSAHNNLVSHMTTRVDALSADVRSVSTAIAAVPRVDPAIARQLGNVVNSIDEARAALGDATTSNIKAAQHFVEFQQEHGRIAEAAARQQIVTTMAIVAQSTASVNLSWDEPGKGAVVCQLDVHAGKIGSVVHINAVSSDCPSQLKVGRTLNLETRETKHLDPLPWTVSVDAVEHRWFGEHYAILRFTREGLLVQPAVAHVAARP